MKTIKFLPLILITLIITSCSSTRKEVYYSDYSVACYVEKNDETNTQKCVPFDNEREVYKWHIVAPWQSLGEKE